MRRALRLLTCGGYDLQAAYSTLYAVRRCNPKLVAIREATCDILYGGQTAPASIVMPLSLAGGASLVQARRQSAFLYCTGAPLPQWGTIEQSL